MVAAPRQRRRRSRLRRHRHVRRTSSVAGTSRRSSRRFGELPRAPGGRRRSLPGRRVRGGWFDSPMVPPLRTSRLHPLRPLAPRRVVRTTPTMPLDVGLQSAAGCGPDAARQAAVACEDARARFWRAVGRDGPYRPLRCELEAPWSKTRSEHCMSVIVYVGHGAPATLTSVSEHPRGMDGDWRVSRYLTVGNGRFHHVATTRLSPARDDTDTAGGDLIRRCA